MIVACLISVILMISIFVFAPLCFIHILIPFFRQFYFLIFDVYIHQYLIKHTNNFEYNEIEFEYKQEHFKISPYNVSLSNIGSDCIKMSEYSINDKPVLYFYKLKDSIFKSYRALTIIEEYSFYKVFKILRLAKKTHQKLLKAKKRKEKSYILR